jgi:hypothetical protein
MERVFKLGSTTENAFSLFLASIAPDHYIYLYQRIFISAKASVPGLVENCTISDSIKQFCERNWFFHGSSVRVEDAGHPICLIQIHSSKS